ncbi:MAG TPA: tetratricopeptide repeat protein, partial [Tepidisphaeraceae bacterium]
MPVLIIAAGLLAYSNSLSGVFVLDDKRSIETNPNIHTLLPTRSSLMGPPYTTFTARPVTMFTFAVNYRLHELRVTGYHVANITVHILAALALWGVMRRTLRLPALQPTFGGREDALAAIIALIWVVHPLTTAAVTYIAQRAESLMALFYLLTLYCFIRGATGPRQRGWFALSVLCCLVGLGAKESLASAPLMVLLYDRTLLAGSFAGAFRGRKLLYICLFATWIPLAALMATHPHGPDVAFSFPELSSFDYLKTQSKVIVSYLKLSFWPHPLVLYHGYADFDLPILRTFPQYAPWGLIVVGLLLLTAWALIKRRPVGLAGALFFMVLGPSSSMISMPSEVMADYRAYLPLAAVISVVVLGAFSLAARAGSRRPITAVGVVAAVVVIALGLTTRARNQDYQSSTSFWQAEVRHSPKNSTALGNLGIVEEAYGQIGPAEQHLRQAIEQRPLNGPVHASLGKILERTGRLAEAIEHYRIACEQNPSVVEHFLFLANALMRQGKLPEAMGVLREGIDHLPWETRPRLLLGALLTQSGRGDEGRNMIDDAVARDPDPANARTFAGQMLLALGQSDAAISQLRQAEAASSTVAATHLLLATALQDRGRIAEAVVEYRKG